MSEQKNIDRLFQEKLKDVEMIPNPEVWNAIEKKLHKKKKRVFPIWWFSSGVVASLVLGFFMLFNNSKESSEDAIIENPIITEEHVKPIGEEKKQDLLPVQKDNTVVDVVLEKGNNKNKKREKRNINKTWASAKVVRGEIERNVSQGELTAEKNRKIYKEGDVKGESSLTKIALEKEQKVEEANTREEKRKDFIAEMKKKNQQEFLKEENKKSNKWKVNPVVGITHSNTLTETSIIDENFNFSGENNIAYGINVENVINDKWSIKSGVQLQKMSFSSNINRVFALKIVDISSANDVISGVESTSDGNLALEDGFNEGEGKVSLSNQDKIDVSEGTINLKQNITYVEVPLEIKYTFLKSEKNQLGVVTGFSTLLLQDREGINEENGVTDTLGKLNDLNTINFSGNLGLDFNVFLLKKLNFNVTPMFKLQLNTISSGATNFNPYTIGIYSGLNYEF